MFKLVAFALFTLLALVNAAPIFTRQTPPSNWDTDNLESYTDYQTRYLALGCQNQSNTQFFNDCCLPLNKRETLQPYCSTSASNTLLAERADEMQSGDDGDENDDDEDDYCEDDDSSSSNESSSPAPTPTPTTSEGPEPTDTPSPTPSSGTPSESHTDGDLTWFKQNGVAGACGKVHSDNDLIAALDSSTYGDTGVQSSYCGKTIRITWQDKFVDVVVADACPTCDNASSVDLSVAAFSALADPSVGLLTGASWVLLD